jgi:hypothetical protein
MLTNHTVRWEGTIRLSDLPKLRMAVPLMSDHQLEYFFKATKNPLYAKVHKVIVDEMARRVIETYHELFGV